MTTRRWSVSAALEERNLTVFLDRWDLVPGRPWPDALEKHLGRCRSAAVVLGPSGMGPWQQREHYLALDRQARDSSFGVIPVILPNADPALGFLSLNTWVDLREGVDDTESMDLLAAAVCGEPPSALLDRTRRAAAQVCPYRGLEIFREEDAPFFFGREDFTEKLREAVAARSLIAVVGASGSGKSSVVRAGLIPSLRRPDGGTVWEVVTLVPGQQPLQALSGALLPLLEPEMTEIDRLVEVNKQAAHLRAGDLHLHQVIERVIHKQQGTDRLLLVVDQWEELYTYAKDEESEQASTRFVDELLTATETARLTVVLTLRADFYGEVLAHRGLSDRLQAALVNLGPMTREELQLAVTKPAEKVGLSFDTGLEDRLLDDVGTEPGNLPLLEFALKELWSARRGNKLLHQVYKAMKGVRGAIAQRAESLYETLDGDQQKTAERVFTRLVRPGDETGDTRRRAELRELDRAGQALARTLAGPEARLLITGRDKGTEQETVEVAHEALIREWERLRGWVGSYRAELQARERLEQLARDWAQGKGELVRGRQRRAFKRLRGGHAAPSGRAEKYLRASGWRAVRRTLAGAVASLAVIGTVIAYGRWIYDHEMSPLMGVYVLAGRAGWILARPEMVEIHPGEGEFPASFWMGSDDGDPAAGAKEKPRREVRLQAPFAIGRHEVTFEQYELFARLTGRDIPPNEGWGTGDRPVINVSWEDVAAYADWLSEKTGDTYRLPTEAEWEYAARAGTQGRYWWCAEEDCDIPPDVANCLGCGTTKGIGSRTLPVGTFPANAYGVHDTAGNVLEWVQDCWHESYAGAPTDGSAWEEKGGGDCGRRVVRGGSWNSYLVDLRSAIRYRFVTVFRNYTIGFRLAQDL